MKKLFVLLGLTYLSYTAFAQDSIPNGNFENWSGRTFSFPSEWSTYGKVTQVTPGYSGKYALRIERDSINIGAPGAVLYGIPGQNNVNGGIPFKSRPDSLVGFFKYNIKTGDSAWVLFIFKLKGKPISSDTNFIIGSNTLSYKRLAFKAHYLSDQTPDSLIIAITSTNPNGLNLGSYLIVDSLHFTGTSLTIPNGGFESWVDYADETPKEWTTQNIYYYPNLKLPVTKTTDSDSGNYAIRLENVYTSNGLAMAFAYNGKQIANGFLPGFPVSYRDTSFNGYYKFYPKNNDTATIEVLLYRMGTIVGYGAFQSTKPVSTYTFFTTKIYYFNYLGIPDSASILLLASAGRQSAQGNSVLYVDNLTFNVVLPRLDQTITFGPLPTNKVGDPEFQLTASSSSGIPVTFTSSNNQVATVNENIVKIVGAGTTEITAYQWGNNDYNPAPTVVQTLTVLPGTLIDKVSAEELRLYPNPSSGILFIQSELLINNIIVYDLLGNVQNIYKPYANSTKIDISKLSNGLYLFKVQCGNSEFLRKIEKK